MEGFFQGQYATRRGTHNSAANRSSSPKMQRMGPRKVASRVQIHSISIPGEAVSAWVSASASPLMCSSTRRWIAWIENSLQSVQYDCGCMLKVYQVRPSKSVFPPDMGVRRNSPRWLCNALSLRWGGWTCRHGESSTIGSGCSVTSKARWTGGSQTVIGSTKSPVVNSQCLTAPTPSPSILARCGQAIPQRPKPRRPSCRRGPPNAHRKSDPNERQIPGKERPSKPLGCGSKQILSRDHRRIEKGDWRKPHAGQRDYRTCLTEVLEERQPKPTRCVVQAQDRRTEAEPVTDCGTKHGKKKWRWHVNTVEKAPAWRTLSTSPILFGTRWSVFPDSFISCKKRCFHGHCCPRSFPPSGS